MSDHAHDTATPTQEPPAAPTVDLKSLDVNRDTGQLLSEMIAKKIEGVVIGRPADNVIVVAVKDASQVYIYDFVAVSTHGQFKATLLQADPRLIDLAHEYVYKVPTALLGLSWKEWLERKELSSDEVDLLGDRGQGDEKVEITGAAVNLVDNIFKEAIALNASDIHLEAFEDGVVVRYRVDGMLQIANQITDLKVARALVKRVKVMGNMDIAQDRVTQGGRVSMKVGGRGYDLRVSVVPVPAGESVVLRILKKSAFNVELSDLGFNEAQLKRWKSVIAHPHGMILVSGPTGSGKSTTLYASLKSIARPDRKLLTVEDPIEYQMPGIVQVQVNMAPREQEKKVTFATALREFLRQDPDVILVGEVRDSETANVSIQAALTGHLVLSTIHTNDAVGIINRLKDQNIKPFLISSTLLAGTAQRLVRRLCPKCLDEVKPSDEAKAAYEKAGVPLTTLYAGHGCEACHGTGFKGRMAIVEMMVIDEQIQDMIEREATSMEVTRYARANGMQSLLQDGLEKAARGLLTLEEVQRVCMMDV